MAETHYLESTDTKDMIVEVLTLLCSVPDNKELKATLTSGINIITYSYDGEQVIVSLGEKYKELSGTTEVLTRAALVRSLTKYTGCKLCDAHRQRRVFDRFVGECDWRHDCGHVCEQCRDAGREG